MSIPMSKTVVYLLVLLIVLSIVSIALVATLPRAPTGVVTVTTPITVPTLSVVTVTAPGAPGATVTVEKTVTVSGAPGATVTITAPPSTVTQTVTVTGTAAPTIPPLAEWLASVAAPYKGVTIRMVTESTPTGLFIRDVLASEFEKITGIHAIVETVSWDEMFRKEISTVQAKASDYDIFYVEQDIIAQYGYNNWLIPLDDFIANPKLTYPGYDLNDIFVLDQYIYNGKILAIPFESFLKIYIYRKDLFEKYGIKLPDVLTWDFVKKVAEFFGTGTKEPGVYGWVAQAAYHPCLFYEMVESVWPTFGVQYWGITNGLEVTFNNTCGKKAYRTYIELLKYAPPGVSSYTWDEVGATFTRGGAAQGLMYAEFFGTIFKQNPDMIGKYGVAYPPIDPDCYRGGYIGYFDMGGMGINPYSKNKEAAWLFIQWVTSKENVKRIMENINTVVRWSALEELGDKLDAKYGHGYFALLKKAIKEKVFRGAPPFPFHLDISQQAYAPLHKAVTGETTPEAAVDEMAALVKKILAPWKEKLGVIPPYT
jgi:multiple sugar transport system substrate-binding protein